MENISKNINLRQCQFCGENIKANAVKCKHCKRWLNENASDAGILDKKTINKLVYNKEKVYLVISCIISVLLYSLIILINHKITLYYVGFLFAFYFILHGLLIGNVKNNCVKITEKQFPDIYEKTSKLSIKIGLGFVPEIYVMQSGGLLNAFETRFLNNKIIVIYSEILELAYEKGEKALEYIISHELSHLKRKHVEKNYFLFPSNFVPFLGKAYIRACEYTCDIIAAHLVPEGAVDGLLILGSGKKLYTNVNPYELVNQAYKDSGFWSWFNEILATHPPLYKRIHEVNSLLINDNQR